MATIVVGVDPSTAGRAALVFAVREALVRQAEVLAVRAWHLPQDITSIPVDPGLVDGLVQELSTAASAVAEDELRRAVEQVPGADEGRGRAIAVQGPAAHVLGREADGAALLVVGSRGAGVLSRAVLGSVSSSVLHHATGPVAVVPDSAGAAAPVARVLVGVDHSPQSVPALRWAAGAAALHGAALMPVHVRDPLLSGGAGGDLAVLELSERTRLRAAAQDAGAGDHVSEPSVLCGQPAAELRQLATAGDLLVVGSRGRGGFAGLLLGSTSTQLAQHATVPVVVVRSG